MKDTFIMPQDHLVSFLRKIKKHHRLVAPVTNQHSDTLFSVITDLERGKVNLKDQPQNSIKSFLFPQQEVLATYQVTENGYQFEANTNSPPPTLFFGVRPCDLTAVLYMDVVFMQKNKDQPFLKKRKDSLIIGLNCNSPFENCFCNAMKCGPFMEVGFDLMFTDLGDKFLVQTGRPKGKHLVQHWEEFFTPAEQEDIQRQYQLSLEAMNKFRLNVHADQAMKRLTDGTVEDSIWEDLSHRCQDCAGCAFICPTCTCFTIVDQPLSENNGERIRCWDACTFAGFTKMAGGHNPVKQKTEAIKQRFMHKLHIDKADHGRPSCVGCGRCVDMCFGGTDIVRFIKRAGEY